jgi:hypothetical protein
MLKADSNRLATDGDVDADALTTGEEGPGDGLAHAAIVRRSDTLVNSCAGDRMKRGKFIYP